MLFESVCGLENENENFFVELWHVCYTKSCVKKFGGGKINEFMLGPDQCHEHFSCSGIALDHHPCLCCMLYTASIDCIVKLDCMFVIAHQAMWHCIYISI